jgi:hypothetical protein
MLEDQLERRSDCGEEQPFARETGAFGVGDEEEGSVE